MCILCSAVFVYLFNNIYDSCLPVCSHLSVCSSCLSVSVCVWRVRVCIWTVCVVRRCDYSAGKHVRHNDNSGEACPAGVCSQTCSADWSASWRWQTWLASKAAPPWCVLLHAVISHSGLHSVLWYCWLGTSKHIFWLLEINWWGVGMVICLERGADSDS